MQCRVFAQAVSTSWSLAAAIVSAGPTTISSLAARAAPPPAGAAAYAAAAPAPRAARTNPARAPPAPPPPPHPRYTYPPSSPPAQPPPAARAAAAPPSRTPRPSPATAAMGCGCYRRPSPGARSPPSRRRHPNPCHPHPSRRPTADRARPRALSGPSRACGRRAVRPARARRRCARGAPPHIAAAAHGGGRAAASCASARSLYPSLSAPSCGRVARRRRPRLLLQVVGRTMRCVSGGRRSAGDECAGDTLPHLLCFHFSLLAALARLLLLAFPASPRAGVSPPRRSRRRERGRCRRRPTTTS